MSTHDDRPAAPAPLAEGPPSPRPQPRPPRGFLRFWLILAGALLLAGAAYESFRASRLERARLRMEEAELKQVYGSVEAGRQAQAARRAEELKEREIMNRPCTFVNVKFPDDMLVYATGGNYGRKLDFQIDQSGNMATQFDIVVNSPAHPVALMLDGHHPTIWNIQWTEGTKIAGVLVTGHDRQVLAGLDRAVPVLNSANDKSYGHSCGYFHAEEQQRAGTLNPMSRQLFGRPVNLFFPWEHGMDTIVVGEPLPSGTRLLTSPATPPSSFRMRAPLW